ASVAGARRVTQSDPEKLRAVARKPRIVRHEHEVLDQRLSHQHSVERITVVGWEPSGRPRVAEIDRQGQEAASGNRRLDRLGGAQTADRFLDGDLPGGRRAHVHDVRGIGDRASRTAPPEPGVILAPPEEDVRVEEQVHSPRPPKASRSSFGSGASKFFATRSLPFQTPGLRGRLPGASGTSFATGLPALAITTSSPDAARSTSWERRVFASYRLTV